MMNAEQRINNLKNLGEFLIPFNYPQTPAALDDLGVLKTTEFDADGYGIIANYNKADYGTFSLITFQVMGSKSPFLPFNLVCKLARKALGNDNLSLVEVYKGRRKIYCWAVVQDKDGQMKPYPYEENEVEQLNYEGFAYTYMHPNQVRYY